MNLPFFSIILPTYNRLERLKNAIASVYNQTFNDWELIVVNDAGTDGTYAYLESLEDDKIRVVHNKENLYKGGARNEGIKQARGKYICFLDDDDFYLEHHLETYFNAIKEKDFPVAAWYSMPITYFSDSNEYKKRILREPYPGENRVAYLFHHKNGVPTPRICAHSTLIKKHKFNPHVKIGQDTEMLLRIAAENDVFPIYAHTAVQVRHESNSGNLNNNTGKYRLEGYNHIFSNPKLNKLIPKKLKKEMIAYCYLRMCDHYQYTGQKSKVVSSALTSIWYAPGDGQVKTKITFVIYNLPGGNLIKRMIRKLKT